MAKNAARASIHSYESVFIRSRNGAPSRKGCGQRSNEYGKRQHQYAPPPYPPQVGKMDAILTDSHLDTRIKIRTRGISDQCDCSKVRVCRRSMERGREVRATTGNSADDSS